MGMKIILRIVLVLTAALVAIWLHLLYIDLTSVYSISGRPADNANDNWKKVKALWPRALIVPASKSLLRHILSNRFRDDASTLTTHGFNCTEIFMGRQAEIRRAERFVRLQAFSSASLQKNASCDLNELPSYNESESVVPLAYSIVVFKNFNQFLKLFKALYRPWHCFCVHVDKKAPESLFNDIKRFANCLPQSVHLAEKREDVKWGRISVLDSAINCINTVKTRCNNNWQYLLNIAGTDYPLKSNDELEAYFRWVTTPINYRQWVFYWGESVEFRRNWKHTEINLYNFRVKRKELFPKTKNKNHSSLFLALKRSAILPFSCPKTWFRNCISTDEIRTKYNFRSLGGNSDIQVMRSRDDWKFKYSYVEEDNVNLTRMYECLHENNQSCIKLKNKAPAPHNLTVLKVRCG